MLIVLALSVFTVAAPATLAFDVVRPEQTKSEWAVASVCTHLSSQAATVCVPRLHLFATFAWLLRCAAAVLHPSNGACHAKRLLPDGRARPFAFVRFKNDRNRSRDAHRSISQRTPSHNPPRRWKSSARTTNHPRRRKKLPDYQKWIRQQTTTNYKITRIHKSRIEFFALARELCGKVKETIHTSFSVPISNLKSF